MNKSLSIGALVVAGASLVLALSKREPVEVSEPLAVEEINALRAELQDTKAELSDLRAAHQKLKEGLVQPVQLPTETHSPDLSTDALQSRIDQLESRQEQLVEFASNSDRYGVVAKMEEDIEKAYSSLMNTNLPVGARLKQIGALKRYGQFDEQALSTVSEIYANTDDFNQKGRALTAMKGLITPEFRDQVLSDLNSDVSAGNQSAVFRYFAIEALEPMLPDPAVSEWLTYLSQNDPESKLAGRAQRALNQGTDKGGAK